MLKGNAEMSRKVVLTVLEELDSAVKREGVLTDAVGAMKFAVITSPGEMPAEDKKKLSYILPYFSD